MKNLLIKQQTCIFYLMEATYLVVIMEEQDTLIKRTELFGIIELSNLVKTEARVENYTNSERCLTALSI